MKTLVFHEALIPNILKLSALLNMFASLEFIQAFILRGSKKLLSVLQGRHELTVS